MKYLIFTLLFIGKIEAETLPLSNTAVIDSLVQTFMMRSLEKIDLSGQPVCVRTDSIYTPLHRYIAFRMEEAFREKAALPIFSTKLPEEGYLADLYIPKAKIFYSRRYAKRLLGRTWIGRSASVEIDLKIFEISENKLLFSESYESSMQDEFLFSKLNDVEQGAAWLHPKIPPLKGIRSWMEPFLFISSISAVVYLFFVIRS